MSILEQFNFNSATLRVAGTSKEPLFCLKDVCDILGISNVTQVAERIPESNLCKTEVATSHGSSATWFVNEPGLYQVIFRSNKPEAEAFQAWVFEEVLPALRQHGKYELPGVESKSIEAPPSLDDLNKATQSLLDITERLAPENPRLAQFMTDCYVNRLGEQRLLPGAPEPQLRGVVEVAQDMNCPVSGKGVASRLGKFVKGCLPHLCSTEKRLVSGAMRDVACYPDTPELRSAIAQFFAGVGHA